MGTILKSRINIDDLIGKPYKEKGRGAGGYDCYGICIEVGKRFGVEFPELKDLIKHEFESIDKPEPCALVLIQTVDTRHVGIMIDKIFMLQIIDNKRGVHKIRVDHPWVKNRIVGYYRYVGQLN